MKDCATVIHRSQECWRNSGTLGLLLPFPAPGPCRGRSPLESAAPERAPAYRAATLLVVEDDRAVRLLFTRVLEGAGYAVIACENGAAGLEAARRRIDEIRAVITDARMPGMSGQKLLGRLRALRPALPAIVVSGTQIDGVADDRTVFLIKPVSPGNLTDELQRLLCGTM
ncbi:MAG TPA: response regulator [Acidobacteriaceae bacterium]|jgi:CheY-like chemotaxis protein|nr:response regulator [Acidobacteriaceae bacterium]